jgi:hypothetical protein
MSIPLLLDVETDMNRGVTSIPETIRFIPEKSSARDDVNRYFNDPPGGGSLFYLWHSCERCYISDMEHGSLTLTDRIENRLQLVLTISIFFPAILYSFFKFVGEPDQSSNSIFLKASTLIIAYLLDYLLFVLLKNFISSGWLKLINILVLLGIASFVTPLIFATSGYATLPIILAELLRASNLLPSILAIAIFLFICIGGAAKTLTKS